MKCHKSVFLMLLAISLVGTGQNSFAQEEEQIEAINQDGEKLDAVRLKVQLQTNEGDQGDSKRISINDGTITIVNEDGSTRKIDITGAQSIMVNKSVQSIVEDGEKKTRVQGKAILIGPDGERQEFDLSGNDLPEMFRFDQLKPGRLMLDQLKNNRTVWRLPSDPAMSWSGGKYMVGVHCNPVSKVLAAQLGLEEKVGIVVIKVSPDSPAEIAGLQQHDILMYAGQESLQTTQDLVKAVQKAGSDGSSISFSVMRRGKEVSVDVTPAERPKIQPGEFEFINPGDLGPGIIQLDEFGPGVIFEADADRFGRVFDEDFQKQFEEMHRMMQEQVERMNQLQRRFDNFEGDDK